MNGDIGGDVAVSLQDAIISPVLGLGMSPADSAQSGADGN
jgi:hypothetical protein